MLTTLTADQLREKIEEQKRVALFGPVHVFTDSSSAPSVLDTCRRYSQVCENPALFVPHTFTSNPGSMIGELAAACPRVLLVVVVNMSHGPSVEWMRSSLPQRVATVPYADAFCVDCGAVTTSERAYLESLKIVHSPTVLTIKMGHIIDTFVPELPRPEYLQQLPTPNAGPLHQEQETKDRRQREKEDFEAREREKQRKADDRERIEKAKERQRVLAKIEEDRKLRRGMM
jgi:hypothetical protein